VKIKDLTGRLYMMYCIISVNEMLMKEVISEKSENVLIKIIIPDSVAESNKIKFLCIFNFSLLINVPQNRKHSRISTNVTAYSTNQ
jgi:hypothetical protein